MAVLTRLRRERRYVQRAALGSPALGTTTAVHAAVTDTGSPQTITTGITSPAVPRVITATAGGTAADVKAISPIIHGTDMNNRTLSETLPAFTVNTTGTVTGTKAFKTVTSIELPAHDGTGATTSFGLGAALGLPQTLDENSVVAAYLNGVKEATAPTVTTSASVLASNTVTLNSALDGSAVVVTYFGR